METGLLVTNSVQLRRRSPNGYRHLGSITEVSVSEGGSYYGHYVKQRGEYGRLRRPVSVHTDRSIATGKGV